MKKLFSVLFIFVSVFICEAAAGADIPLSFDNTGLDEDLCLEITDFASQKMDELHSPGLGIGIVKGDRLVYAGYLGYADMETEKPVTRDTMFRIGSISKTFTAIGLMQQWELGRFGLDDDVNKYFPEPLIFPPHPETRPVTFRHLLTHTSGGGEFLSYRQAVMPGFGVIVQGDEYPPLSEVLKSGMSTKVDPGLKYAYCNYGFAFLGHALENMAGAPFHEYMEKKVLEPLGMKKSTFHHNAEILADLATGYKWKGGEYAIDPHKAANITPAGQIYTNVPEMANYVIAVLNGGSNKHGSVIRRDTLEMMMDKHYGYDDRQAALGLAYWIYSMDFFGQKVVGHSGSVPWGFTAHMLLCPDSRTGVYVFSNSGTYSPREIGWGILKILLGGEDKELRELEGDESVFKELAGIYGPEYRDFQTSTRIYMNGVGAYKVVPKDGGLMLVYLWQGNKNAKRLVQVDPGDPYFYELYEESDKYPLPRYVSFERGDSGRVEYISPDGLNRYKRLGSARRARVMMFAVPGRIIYKASPFGSGGQ